LSLARYAVLVLGVAAASLALAWLLGLRRLDAGARWAALFGGVLAVVNTIAAHALVLWSAHRSTSAFLGALLGGMVARMAVMLLAVVAGVLLLDLPKLPLAVSLLSYFVLFLVVEVTILHRRTTTASPGAAR
jgi:hypothetical protein